MHCPRFLLPTVAMGLLLGALPAVAQAQSMDKNAKPAMGAMKDTSAMKHDGGMGKDAMGKDGKPSNAMMDDKSKKAAKDKAKATDAMMDKGAMAEPAKKSQP